MSGCQRFLLSFVIFAVVMIYPFLNAEALGDGAWDASSYLWSKGHVAAVTVFDGELYASGVVPQGRNSRGMPLGRWDGESWVPVPGAPNGAIHILFPFNNTLMIAGKLNGPKNGRKFCVASWTGTEWMPLRSRIQGIVTTLVEYRGELIAGGEFSGPNRKGKPAVSNLARWDGGHWQPLGPPLAGGGHTAVHALTVHDGKLYVGGVFTKAGDLKVRNIAAWDGKHWSALGRGADDPVMALTVYDGQLVAGGRFRHMGGAAHVGVARWNGNRWLGLGDGLPMGPYIGKNFEIRTLGVVGADLAVGGDFPLENSTDTGLFCFWNGESWRPIDPPLDYKGLSKDRRGVSSFVEFDGGLVLGGAMVSATGTEVGTVAFWKDSSWSSLGCGAGLRSKVSALFQYNGRPLALHEVKGSGQTLSFWDGSSWQGLDRHTKSGNLVLKSVSRLACRGDEIIIFGEFENSDQKSLRTYARYQDGWVPLKGSWLSQRYTPRQMIFHGRELVVAESSTRRKTPPRVRTWDGTIWKTLEGSAFNRVDALQSDGRNIYLTVHRQDSEKNSRWVVAWDGSNWRDILEFSQEPGPVVLHIHDGMLHVGLSRIDPDDSSLVSVMRWDGQTWSHVGKSLKGTESRHRDGVPLSATIGALATYQGHLVVTGRFTRAGDKPSPALAWFDGVRWMPWQGAMWGGQALLPGDDCLWIGGSAYDGSFSGGINCWRGPIPRQVQVQREVAARKTSFSKTGKEKQTADPSARAVESINQLLSAMEESYPRLDRLGEAWPMLARKYRREAAAVKDEKAFELLVKDFLSRLKDRTIIFKPNHGWSRRKPSADPRSGILKKLSNYDRQLGWVGDDICYILMNQPRFYSEGQGWFEQAGSAGGIILDLRVKSGEGINTRRGDQNKLLNFIGILTDTPQPYGVTLRRLEKTGCKLSIPDTLLVKPIKTQFNRLPVVCLIDSSVSGHLVELALALKAMPGVKLVGTGTGILLDSARLVEMDFGGKVWIPLQRTYTLDGQELTDRQGVPPDVLVNPHRGSEGIFDTGVDVLHSMMEDR